MERTDTKPKFTLLPEGEYQFTVAKTPIKKLTPNGKPYYIFPLETVLPGNIHEEHQEFIMCWMAGAMLRALGCKEVETDVFEWEKEEVVGKKIKAKVVHAPDRKDPTKTRASLVDIVGIKEEEIPF